MPRFMLDTDTCSFIIRSVDRTIMRQIRYYPADDVCISVITKSELLFGVAVSSRGDQADRGVSAFLRRVTVLDFPEAAAEHYAEIRAALRARGQPIGANDLFLAAHARCLGLTLVTNNTREFARVPGLALDNWTRRRAH
jgi:tRNA(fMet)-specific endonuclease VapC